MTTHERRGFETPGDETKRDADVGASRTRYAIALLLFIAAIAKAHELATRPTAEGAFFTSRIAMTCVVELEIFLSIWLFGGWRRRLSWYVTFLCFGAFFTVTMQRAWAGFESCGCFGAVNVNPWVTLTVDGTIIVGLLVNKPRWTTGPDRSDLASVGRGAALFVAVGTVLAVWMSSFQSGSLSQDGVIVGKNGIVLLEPEEWVGETLPLLDFIDGASALATGQWTVFLHKHDCSKCLDVLPEFLRRSDKHKALVEIPPYGGEMPHRGLASVVDLKLRPDHDWFVKTPVEIHLSDAVVTSVVSDFRESSNRHP